jgi:hypothetical protein
VRRRPGCSHHERITHRRCCEAHRDEFRRADFLPDGKARKPYEFGVKVSLAITHQHGLMVGARSFAGDPYDGHTLAEQLEQTNTLLQDIGTKPSVAIFDLGFRGVDEPAHRCSSSTAAN